MNVKIYLKSKKNDIDAIATFNTDTKEVTVKKGSRVSEHVGQSEKFRGAASVEKQREGSVKDKTVIKDVLFKSPSTAANFVTGTSTNGWVAWKTEKGESIKQAYSEGKNE